MEVLEELAELEKKAKVRRVIENMFAESIRLSNSQASASSPPHIMFILPLSQRVPFAREPRSTRARRTPTSPTAPFRQIKHLPEFQILIARSSCDGCPIRIYARVQDARLVRLRDVDYFG